MTAGSPGFGNLSQPDDHPDAGLFLVSVTDAEGAGASACPVRRRDERGLDGRPKAPDYLKGVKALLDDVNVEDKGCVERVWRGLCAGLSAPGALSHLERPNYDFARWIASRMP